MARDKGKITVERVVEHAELAACYFRALAEKGVPAMAAVNLTGSYVGAVVITQASGENPQEPWEGWFIRYCATRNKSQEIVRHRALPFL